MRSGDLMSARHGFSVLALVLVGIVPARAAAQWHAGLETGRMRSALDPTAAESSVGIGLRYHADDAGLQLTAGAPLASGQALWGGLAGWKRGALRRGALLMGVDVSGTAFLIRTRLEGPLGSSLLPGPRDPGREVSGHAFAGQLLPVLGWEGARVRVHARAGISHHTTSFDGRGTDRTVRLADVQVTLTPSRALALVPVVRGFQATGEDAVTYLGISGALTAGRATAWAGAGQWIGADAEVPWEMGASLRLHERISVTARARRETFDPLYQRSPQTAWSVGVSLRVGGSSGRPALPVPAAYERGRATIRLPVAGSSTAPSIAGDFNGWEPAPMVRSDDQWTYSVALAPGVYQYAFVDGAGEWFVPESVPGRKEDGMGGHVAVLVVE